jgi:glutamate synthase domain-containing protein 3
LDIPDVTSPRCNLELVDLEELEQEEDIAELRAMIEAHQEYTGSTVAQRILTNWDRDIQKFVKVMPRDYKIALERLAREEEERGLLGTMVQ